MLQLPFASSIKSVYLFVIRVPSKPAIVFLSKKPFYHQPNYSSWWLGIFWCLYFEQLIIVSLDSNKNEWAPEMSPLTLYPATYARKQLVNTTSASTIFMTKKCTCSILAKRLYTWPLTAQGVCLPQCGSRTGTANWTECGQGRWKGVCQVLAADRIPTMCTSAPQIDAVLLSGYNPQNCDEPDELPTWNWFLWRQTSSVNG